MNAQELRIGNITNLGRVYEIKENKFYVYDDERTNYGSAWAKIEPIPLTEEWHFNFGAVQTASNDFVYKISSNKTIIFSSDYVFMRDFEKDLYSPSMEDNICTLWNKDIRKRDMYLHEWQNMFYILTGEELT